MLGLGNSLSSLSAVVGVSIEDYMWEILSAGNIAPREIVTDFSDSWDVVNGDFTPAHPAASEGYWETVDDGELRPLDV